MNEVQSLFSLNNKSWSNVKDRDNTAGSRKSGILVKNQTIDTSFKPEIPRQKTTKVAVPTPRVQYNKVFEMAKHLEKPLLVCSSQALMGHPKNLYLTEK